MRKLKTKLRDPRKCIGPPDTWGAALALARFGASMTQAELGHHLRVSDVVVSQWEAQIRVPRPYRFAIMARLFHWDLDKLLLVMEQSASADEDEPT